LGLPLFSRIFRYWVLMLTLNVWTVNKIMKILIEVFRMTEVSSKVRANIIVKLGNAINHEYSMNLTEPLVA